MKFVSYAQNFEDVLLYRALKHIRNGRYVDIGAHDPTRDSVSLAFHNLGWVGLHVEPQPRYAAALKKERAGDQVIEAAVSTNAGPITLFEVGDGTGISTCDQTLAQRHKKRGFSLKKMTVPCMRLSEILNTYCAEDVHWMKIDVEGFEGEVIRSWQGSLVRPWIVLLESTEPNTTVANFSTWEADLLALGYKYVHFDGLNRYYVSENHPEISAAFNAGPNYFDNFVVTQNHWIVAGIQFPEQSALGVNGAGTGQLLNWVTSYSARVVKRLKLNLRRWGLLAGD